MTSCIIEYMVKKPLLHLAIFRLSEGFLLHLPHLVERKCLSGNLYREEIIDIDSKFLPFSYLLIYAPFKKYNKIFY